MAEPVFDPAGYYEFDLDQGSVHTRDGTRVLMVSDNAMARLVSSLVESDVGAVRKFGKELGLEAARSLGEVPDNAPPERAFGHVSSILSLFGWGRLEMERWGDALVARVQDAPELDARRWGLSSLLGGVLSGLTDREVACVPVPGPRYVVVAPDVAKTVLEWVEDGADLATVITRLARPEGP
jgi:hypothetical protein